MAEGVSSLRQCSVIGDWRFSDPAGYVAANVTEAYAPREISKAVPETVSCTVIPAVSGTMNRAKNLAESLVVNFLPKKLSAD